MNVRRRAQIALGAVLAAFGLLSVRLAQIQVFAAGEYRDAGAHQRRALERRPEPRGEIRALDGTPLAFSEPGFDLWADPARVDDPEPVARAIAETTGEDAMEVVARFWQARKHVRIARGLSLEEAQAVRDLGMRGLRLEEGLRRICPLAAASAPLLGTVSTDGGGIEGLEYAWDAALAGRAGQRELDSDALHRKIDLGDGRQVPGLPGANLVLSIDAALQRIVYEEMARAAEKLSPRGGAAVAIDPRTGGLRAMVSWPSYDPACRRLARDSSARNRVIQDAYEPGSTFKPFAFAWAVERGAARPGEMIDCERGQWRALPGRTIHDVHPLGTVRLDQGLIRSSNIAAAKLGRRLGADRLYECVKEFGFGSSTSIGLPGEANGIVRPRAGWSSHTVISVPFGQELAVTPLQLATGYAALVNGGLRYRPRLIERLVDADGRLLREFPREPPRRILSAETSAWVRRTLHRVVEEGTGRRARVPGLKVGGKTGTAQKYEEDPATGRARVSSTKVVASFVGFAPADDPELVCLVMWDEPRSARYGGVAAAPVVARIFTRALGGTQEHGGS